MVKAENILKEQISLAQCNSFHLCRAVKDRYHHPVQSRKEKLTLQQPVLLLARPPHHHRSLRTRTDKIDKINRTISDDEFHKPQQEHSLLRSCGLKRRIHWSQSCLHSHPSFTPHWDHCHVPEAPFLHSSWNSVCSLLLRAELLLEKICDVFAGVDWVVDFAGFGVDDRQCSSMKYVKFRISGIITRPTYEPTSRLPFWGSLYSWCAWRWWWR